MEIVPNKAICLSLPLSLSFICTSSLHRQIMRNFDNSALSSHKSFESFQTVHNIRFLLRRFQTGEERKAKLGSTKKTCTFPPNRLLDQIVLFYASTIIEISYVGPTPESRCET